MSDQRLNFNVDNPGNIVGIYWGYKPHNTGSLLFDSHQILLWVDEEGNPKEVKAYYKIYGRHSPAPPEVRAAHAEGACKPEAERIIDGWNNPPEGKSEFVYALHKVEYVRTENSGSNTSAPPGHGTNWEGWGDGICHLYFTKSPR
ncbi:hypothetical protein ABD68_19235 [Bacillus endophyticus]|uniref:hypothetical protein n=1 Tax=Priestia endophytica TaxID=135735 RepID=UPI0018CE1AA6|nr:hypothetical protein [Priestia endophytica]MBG9813631.1 hypothetical protein [Priestia endophytica]